MNCKKHIKFESTVRGTKLRSKDIHNANQDYFKNYVKKYNKLTMSKHLIDTRKDLMKKLWYTDS